MKPGNIDTVRIGDDEARRIQDWYEHAPADRAPADTTDILDVKNLSFSYDGKRKAIDDISVKIKHGEMLAIVGTNGAGKSTFSKVLCGFEKENSGQIFYEGKDFAQFSIKERADRIGYVMQNPNQMISKVMIFDEVALGLRTRGIAEDEIKTRVEDTLKICGLWPFRNWPVSALSYGQKKRVTIASIMVLEPKVIILDEPTAGQDYRHYTEIMEFLTELNQRGITVIMITHDMHLMLEYADRSIAFSNGKIIKDADCAEVLTDAEIIERASLKETSLYELCKKAGIADGTDFVRRFIAYEREVVRQ